MPFCCFDAGNCSKCDKCYKGHCLVHYAHAIGFDGSDIRDTADITGKTYEDTRKHMEKILKEAGYDIKKFHGVYPITNHILKS